MNYNTVAIFPFHGEPAHIEGLRGEKSIAQICRERDISIENAEEIFADRREYRKEENEGQIAELERMVGRLTMENDI